MTPPPVETLPTASALMRALPVQSKVLTEPSRMGEMALAADHPEPDLGPRQRRQVPMSTWLLSTMSKRNAAGQAMSRPSFCTWDSPIAGVAPKPVGVQAEPTVAVQ